MSRRTRLLLIVAGSVVGVAVLALIAVNLLISADWVRDRVAKRIMEQTGRELKVEGTTALLFTPGPHIVMTDATFSDPEERAGTADFSVGRVVIDLNLFELMSRQIDAERVVLERPVLTVRLGDEDRPKPKRERKGGAKAPGEKQRRDVKLRDVRIEDGTVNIVYDDEGTAKQIEHISANLSLPTLTAPFTGTGKLDWKEQTVAFNFELTSLAELREKRPTKLTLAVDMPAIAARFDGNMLTRPHFSGQGELSAKARSIPSLLAWMREKPEAAAAIGDGELASHLAWDKGEITLSAIRFALEHANGQGQAVVTLKSPRPYIRAALALDDLDLNPFLPSGRSKAARGGGRPQADESNAPPRAESAMPRRAPAGEAPPESGQPRDWFSKPDADQSVDADRPEPDAAPEPPSAESAPPAPDAAVVAAVPAPSASPASFDADVNVNVRKARVAHLEIGPSSLGLAFRDGVLNATLGGMELYDGHATGKLVLDAAKPVPTFTGDFLLDGVQAKPLLSDAAQFSLLEGHAKLTLQISGEGTTAEAIKSSLAGQGNLAVSDGAIDDRGHRHHRDDQSDRRWRDPGHTARAGRQDGLHRSWRQLHHYQGHCRDQQSPDDQSAPQGGGGGHRGSDAKHDRHAGQARDHCRARRAGWRQRSCRNFRAGAHRRAAGPSYHQARAQGHVRQSREGRQNGAADRRGLAKEIQRQAGRRSDRPLPRQCPDRPRRWRRRWRGRTPIQPQAVEEAGSGSGPGSAGQ
jgi:uncharacterized protein involved in outer membrane biogenesis